MTSPGLTQVFLSLALVAISIAVARWWRIPVAKDMAIGSVRAFIQLVAVGYALHFIFDLESPWMIHLAIAVMVLVGAQTSSARSEKLPGGFLVSFLSIVAGSMVTLGTMLLIDVIEFEARYVIPLGGMIVSNSMNASALTVNRLVADLRTNRLAIETSLSLGMTWRKASHRYLRSASITGMISILNFMKTAGIVALPGAMTGMILAGAEPLDAVLLQIVVAYMLLSATAITSIAAAELTARKFFTPRHQFRYDL